MPTQARVDLFLLLSLAIYFLPIFHCFLVFAHSTQSCIARPLDSASWLRIFLHFPHYHRPRMPTQARADLLSCYLFAIYFSFLSHVFGFRIFGSQFFSFCI